MQSGQISGSLSFNGTMTKEDEEMSRSALSTFKAKEEEIEKKKLEVREKVQAQLGRIEEETRRLATIREELEALADPMKKEVSLVRKKIDTVNKELKPLGQTCQKKEREYKEALEAFNEKHKEKVQLITRLTEVSNVGFHCFSQFHYSSLPLILSIIQRTYHTVQLFRT
nr:structural maintenance of chromosomes protein 1A-like isoform X2 [Ipomoea batatas]